MKGKKQRKVAFIMKLVIPNFRMLGFGEPKHSVNFLVFRRDKDISKNNFKKLVRGAIRLPIIF